MSVDRRQVVQAALLAALWPAYWAHASSVPATGADVPSPAVPTGRPRLLFVVPADEQLRYARGIALGALLNHGDDAVLSALALCDVACADAATIAKAHAVAPPDGVWFVLVEPGKRPVRVASVSVAPAVPGDPSDDDPELERLVRAAGAELVALVLPDRDALARYAAAAGPGSPAARALAGWDGRGIGEGVRRPLAEAERAAWVSRVAPGSRWWRNSGCGDSGPETPTPAEIEASREVPAMDCGMGHVPAIARRVLRFL